MKKQGLLEKLAEVFEEERVEASQMLEDLIWDSLTKMAIIALYHDELDIELTPAELDKVETIQDLLDLANVA